MANDAVLVAMGAVPGAWLRFRVVNHYEPMIPRKHWGTFGVNVVACFCLGLLVGLDQSCGPSASRLLLLMGTGFLGSFSTFSTLMAELFVVLRELDRTGVAEIWVETPPKTSDWAGVRDLLERAAA